MNVQNKAIFIFQRLSVQKASTTDSVLSSDIHIRENSNEINKPMKLFKATKRITFNS